MGIHEDLAILGLGGEGAYMGVAPSNDWFSVRTHGAGPPGIELTWDTLSGERVVL
jgi:hypothetical protein